MKKLYHDLISKMWRKHEETPLSANETALYLFLLDIGYKLGWSMLIRLHNSEVCPLLMEKSALEKARKKLQDKGMITCTASRSPRHLPTYALIGCETDGSKNKSVSKDERIMTGFLARMWEAFDERALNASEVALFAYILHEVERNLWQMPVRIKDYMPLMLLLKQSCLNDARNELAARNLIAFDVGDGKRDVPKYTLVGIDSITSSSKAVSSNGTLRPKPKTEKKPGEPAAETRVEANADVKTEANVPVVTDMLPKDVASTDEVHSKDEANVNTSQMTEQVLSVIETVNKDMAESDSYVSTNQSFNNASKPIDIRRSSFGMTGNGRKNELRDEYDFRD